MAGFSDRRFFRQSANPFLGHATERRLFRLSAFRLGFFDDHPSFSGKMPRFRVSDGFEAGITASAQFTKDGLKFVAADFESRHELLAVDDPIVRARKEIDEHSQGLGGEVPVVHYRVADDGKLRAPGRPIDRLRPVSHGRPRSSGSACGWRDFE